MNGNAKIEAVQAVVASGGSSASGDFRQSRTLAEAERTARYRLVIEEGPQRGSFIYKTLDRETGEVVRQFPREKVVEMMTSDSYASGSVIDTSI